MAQYCLLKDGKILRPPQSLPASYAGISGFEHLSDEELKKHSWVPAIGYGYNPKTQVRGEPDIYEDKVIYVSVEKTITQIKEEQKHRFKPTAANELAKTDWYTIRHIEQKALKIKTSLTEEEYQMVLAGRQSIRKKSNDKEAEIMAAETIEDIFNVHWDDKIP